MSIVLNRSHIDSLSGWDKVKALRAEAKFCESMSEHSPGSLRTDYIYAAHELTKEANLLSTQLSGVKLVATTKADTPGPTHSLIKTLILSPIRALRRLLRRLEESTRP
jgi:hypothetical protein